MINYDALIARVVKREGGDLYVSNPADAGGPTKYGITLATLAEWHKMPVSADDVRRLTEDEAVRIYRTSYFPSYLTLIPEPAVVEFLFDYGVNSGVAGATRAVQRVLKVADDGIFGPKSQAALATVKNWPAFFYAVKCERLETYLRYVGRDQRQATFAIGWANRSDQFELPLS